MCHGARIRLSPAETKEVRKLWGVMVPIYASVALCIAASIFINYVPRSNEGIAVAKIGTSTSEPAQR
jgi:hypothetical protein